MYRWRKMTDEERERCLQWREALDRPSHSVPHLDSGQRHYLITAACFEHRPHIGRDIRRINEFTQQWLSDLRGHCTSIVAWVVLPNHYHALVSTTDVLGLLKTLGKLHGRTARFWNLEENTIGRQVWCNATETVIKSPDHFGAARKYVHHNPVKHGYVAKWTEWVWSSAEDYLAEVGRDEALREWGLYDIGSFGAGWDEAKM